MGTMIQARGLTEADYRGERFRDHGHDLKGNHDVLALSRPDVLTAIHREYLEAGADIVETNTFSSNRVSQSDYRLEAVAREGNVAAAKAARAAGGGLRAEGPGPRGPGAGSQGPPTP